MSPNPHPHAPSSGPMSHCCAMEHITHAHIHQQHAGNVGGTGLGLRSPRSRLAHGEKAYPANQRVAAQARVQPRRAYRKSEACGTSVRAAVLPAGPKRASRNRTCAEMRSLTSPNPRTHGSHSSSHLHIRGLRASPPWQRPHHTATFPCPPHPPGPRLLGMHPLATGQLRVTSLPPTVMDGPHCAPYPAAQPTKERPRISHAAGILAARSSKERP